MVWHRDLARPREGQTQPGAQGTDPSSPGEGTQDGVSQAEKGARTLPGGCVGAEVAECTEGRKDANSSRNEAERVGRGAPPTGSQHLAPTAPQCAVNSGQLLGGV